MFYDIVRMYQNDKYATEVIAENVTLEEAQAHCNDPETNSETCLLLENVARTVERGPWFDGYRRAESKTFTDQDGVVWDWAFAVCPRCRERAERSHYHFTSMTSFKCPSCGLLYDEPDFEPAEAAYIGEIE